MTSAEGARPAEPEEPPIRFTDNRKIRIDDDAPPAAPAAGGPPADAAPSADETAAPSTQAEPDVPTVPLEDLQRLSAEYTNYRRRAERERLAAGEVATGKVVTELLPVLDDLDRAKAHGDLTGALKAVADKLDAVFGKLGVAAFGEVGDPFDPSRHEAVMHDESDAVTVPTCTTVMRQGYLLGDRLVRPAMVGVSDPVGGAGPEVADAIEDATAGAERHTTEADDAAEQPQQSN
ncbi:Molecular chaperone GrpE (heat shock protein) [Jatrophihabitans endophyticus]|uniref:Protein GrpE n=1 Tax=Jatrophihabitans endophyticus TaxID=1206085 RepID=A0A1M5IPM3_9ACTN|nr:nucleotide exchange factor GrpE [Jatrophihabitans endophyticus]SHG30195.1 Molecular chaperone GrpE (heat shock protein) [Jatrophihabitans endophyticus]